MKCSSIVFLEGEIKKKNSVGNFMDEKSSQYPTEIKFTVLLLLAGSTSTKEGVSAPLNDNFLT